MTTSCVVVIEHKCSTTTGCSQVPKVLWEQLLVNRNSNRERSTGAHNAANVSVIYNPTERLGLSVRRVDNIRDVCELGVAALPSFLDRKVLNVDVSGTFGRPICVHYVDDSLVILVKQC